MVHQSCIEPGVDPGLPGESCCCFQPDDGNIPGIVHDDLPVQNKIVETEAFIHDQFYPGIIGFISRCLSIEMERPESIHGIDRYFNGHSLIVYPHLPENFKGSFCSGPVFFQENGSIIERVRNVFISLSIKFTGVLSFYQLVCSKIFISPKGLPGIPVLIKENGQ